MSTQTKKEIRSSLLARRNELTKEDISKKSGQIQSRLYGEMVYQECGILLTYVSYQSEVDTWEIISRAWEDGKKVFVPKTGKNGQMEFYRIQSYKELEPGFHGIMEPDGSTARFQPEKEQEEPVLILVPGCAFDTFGNRIGYGGGYYDRYFARLSKGVKAALSYDFQLLGKITADRLDQKMDEIITEKRVMIRKEYV